MHTMYYMYYLTLTSPYILYNKFLITLNHHNGVMVFQYGKLCEFDPWLDQIKDDKIGFGASPLNQQCKGIRTKTG